MIKIKDRIEMLLNAITFAETGDYDSAREFLDHASSASTRDSQPTQAPVECTQIDEGIVEELEKHLVATGVMKHGAIKEALATLGLRKKPTAILLAVRDDTLYASSLCYAVSLCQRLDAHLEILQVIDDACEAPNRHPETHNATSAGQPELSIHRLSKSGLPFQITMRAGEFTQAVNEYLKTHKHVAVVVHDSPAAQEDRKEWKRMHRFIEDLSHRLAIPLVTVAPR
jgi:hypothetical protein